MRLDFLRFIIESQLPAFLVKHSVICFVGSDYPFLFLTQLRTLMSRDGAVELIDIAQEESKTVIGRLSTSFLGNRVTYIITGIDDESRTKSGYFFTYLEAYSGPHTLILYVTRERFDTHLAQGRLGDNTSDGRQGSQKPLGRSSDDTVRDPLSNQILQQSVDSLPSQVLTVFLPDKIDKQVFTLLLPWFGIELNAAIKNCIQKLFDRFDYIEFEPASILMRYVPLGMNENLFFQEWLDLIVTPDQSMFSLSQYLFQRDSTQFFMQWKQIKDAYSSQFWIVFWSEQVWRAAFFVHFSKQRKYSDARKIAYRLPFSFINRDWRKYTASELIAAHDFLYQLDYRFKNNDNSIGLDLFYARFFAH